MADTLSYDDFKARIDIQDVLKDAGYHFYRRDGLRYPSYVRLDSDGSRVRGDKFIVTANGKCCFQPPQQKVYNVISFITEHPDFFQEYHAGINPHHLVNLVCNRLLNHPIEQSMRNITEPKHNVKPFDIKDYSVLKFKKHDMENIKKFYPFFKERMIDIATQKAFSSSFMLATKQSSEQKGRYFKNLSFPLHVPGQTAIVGFEERGKPRLDGTSGYKGKALGSNSSEGLWIASPNGTALKDAKDVLWFESAYDAMAYYQLHAHKDKRLGDAVFLSTGGNPTVMQFRGVIKEAQNARHRLCFDNDMAGKQFAMNFNIELRHVKESIPKYGEDMRDYMDSLYDKDNYLSGNKVLLPDDVGKLYGRYETEAEEYLSMKQSRLCYEGDVKEQLDKANRLHEEFVNKMKEKLCIGSEYGHLKSLGTYDIPDWAICAMENGDYEGLTEEEEKLVTEFLDKHFPEGYVSNIDFDDYDELNLHPAFGTRNSNALVSHGESPYEAVKTYSVQFFHPTQRESYALPNLTVVREVPEDGSKDWNDQLIRQEAERIAQRCQDNDEERTVSAGVDLDNNGEVEVSESEEKKHHHSIGR